MTLDPNMFLPTALVGHAQMIPDPTNTFISQVANILGSAAAGTVTGPTGTTATANAVGLVCFKVVFPAGAATSTLTVTTPDAVEIVDVVVNKIGAGVGTVQVQNTAGTAISDAIAYAADKLITRMGSCDATTPTNLVAAGGTFKVVNTFTSGTGIQSIVTVVARRT